MIPNPSATVGRTLIAAVACAVAMLAACLTASSAAAAPSDYDFQSVSAALSTSQAGAHPDFTTTFQLTGDPTNTAGDFTGQPKPWDDTKSITVELPPGLTGNVASFPTCSVVEFLRSTVEITDRCPKDAQVGIARFGTWGLGLVNPPGWPGALYNMPSPGGDVVARLGFVAALLPVIIDVRVDPSRDNALTASTAHMPGFSPVTGTTVTLWGVPADPSHDAERGIGVLGLFPALMCSQFGSCPPPQSVTAPHVPYMTNPTSCDPAEVTFRATAYKLPDRVVSATTPLPDMTGCENVPFDPSMSVSPTTRGAASPSGIDVEMGIPQSALTEPNAGLASAHLKKAVVTLPEGMGINPSAADGLGSCSMEQIGLTSTSPIRFDGADPQCPDSSKVGTAKITTPVLDDPLEGSLYLAEQDDNPFNSLLAGYMVAKGNGVTIKLAGNFQLDERTGRVQAIFDNNPQQPFSKLELHFKGGSRGVLTTPSRCGDYQVTSELTPWSGTSPKTIASTFTIDQGCGTGGFAPTLEAGTASPLAGEFSPFHARMTRTAGEKEFGHLAMTLPKGLVARLKGVPLCTNAQIAAATGRSGTLSRSKSACPAASQIGTVTVGVGSGSLFYPRLPGTDVSGRVFLTEAYKDSEFHPTGAGEPVYGLAAEVPAVAGPFDLGTVMDQVGIYVDPSTAQLTVIADRMDRILRGVRLEVRDVQIDIDRAGFTVNPTSCDPMQVNGAVYAQDGTRADRDERFQVGGCAGLDLAPKLNMRLVGRGQTRQGGHPALRTVLHQGSDQANIARARVVLPRSLALDHENANDEGLLCPYEKGLASDCPASSIVGHATAVSPLLNRPLRGPVHFVQGVRIDKRTGARIRTLPTLLVRLRGEIPIDLRASSSVSRGRLVTTFSTVPDARVSRFRLNLMGGKRKGILTVTGRPNLCQGVQRSAFTVRGHSARVATSRVAIKTPCAKPKRLNLRRDGR